MSKMVLVPVETMQKSAAFVQGAAALMDNAEALSKKVADVSTGVVDRLISNGQLAPALRETKLAALRSDPIGTLVDLVTKFSDTAKSAGSLGKPAGATVQKEPTADEAFERRLFSRG